MQIRIRKGILTGLCKRLDISRAELARRLGVSESTAWRIDAGQANPGTKLIAAVITLTQRPFEDSFEVVEDDAA